MQSAGLCVSAKCEIVRPFIVVQDFGVYYVLPLE